MFECTYDIIDSLIPPTLETDKEISGSLLRLESISACVIVRDTNSCKWLSKTPRRLHPVIWKAYLRDEYYKHKENQEKLELSELPELLYHWPDEEFSLKEIMPSLPAKLSWFSLFWHEYEDEFAPLDGNQCYLSNFYDTAAQAIFEIFRKSKSKVINETFKNSKSIDFCNTHTSECKIRKLNISGLVPDGNGPFSLDQSSELSRSVTTKYGGGSSMTKSVAYDNLFGKNIDKIEVILNASVSFDLNYESNHNKSTAKKKKNKNSKSNSVYRCGQLAYYGSDFSRLATSVIGKSINKETKSITVGTMSETETLKLINLFGTTTEQINILSLGLIGGFCEYSSMPLNFLQYLKNLEHLRISNTDLHGKLEPLLLVEKGLLYLFLNRCKLNNSDLEVLLRSKHKSTLLELNLGSNRFNKDSTNLIKLCQELPKVIKLNLDNCKLENLHDDDLQFLCESLCSLPNLAHLILSDNEFSTATMKSHLTSLSSSPSLRLLELQMPIKEISVLQGSVEMKYAVIKKLSALINKTMNKDRGQLLYVDFGDYLKVEDYRFRELDPYYY